MDAPQTPSTTEQERNKALVRAYMASQALSRGDRAALARFFADDVVFNNSPDVDSQLARMRAVRSALPDLSATIEDQIAEGDRVVTRVTFRGTHRGTFRGVAPTGRPVTYMGIAIDRVRDGKIVEMWHVANMLELLQQIGAPLPPVSASS